MQIISDIFCYKGGTMAKYQDLDRLLQSFVDERLPGCAFQMTQHGKTLYEGYFGYADRERGIPVTRDSLFRQASLSKIPLYTVMMMLYEKGLFNLTDPISRWLPEWKESRKFIRTGNGSLRIVPTERPINVSDVLSMKCGLPYCNSPAPTNDPAQRSMQECMKPLWEKGHYSVQEHIAAMSKAVLDFEPGTHWLYGFSSEITAALIEKLTDMPVDDAFRKLLFDPLGMDHTGSSFFGNAQANLVKLYACSEDGKLTPAATDFDSKFLPGEEHEAGWRRLFSNVSDYSKLFSMLACGGIYDGVRIMGRKTIDMMRSNGLDEIQMKDFTNLYNAGYGYGYGVRTLVDKQLGNHNGSLGAFGWTGAFGTWGEADPEDGISLVYMHNMLPNYEAYYHLRVRTVAYGCVK